MTHIAHTSTQHEIRTYNGTSVYWDPTCKRRNHFILHLLKWREKELYVCKEDRNGDAHFLPFKPTSGQVAHNGVISGSVKYGQDHSEWECAYVGKTELWKEVMGADGWKYVKVRASEFKPTYNSTH